MTFKKFVIILCLCLSSSAAKLLAADEIVDYSFNLECNYNGRTFNIDFSSPSKDWTEDDMTVTFIKNNEAGKVLKLPTKTYYYTDHISKTQDSICKALKQVNPFSAYAVNDHQAVLFVLSSGRPGLNMVHAVLIDTKTGELLDSKELGRSKNHFVAVLKTKAGFKLRLARDSMALNKVVSCDCDASIVDDWMEVRFKKGKIDSSWIR